MPAAGRPPAAAREPPAAAQAPPAAAARPTAARTRTAAQAPARAAAATATADRPPGRRPRDIYQSGSTPCVAAHSTVRALYASYSKALYQVRRASDKTTKDIPVLAGGGFPDTSVQDSFCAGTMCTISLIYDQSPQGNHLTKAPPGATWLPNGGVESSATAGKIRAGDHTVYGIYVTDNSNVAYRNNHTTGVAAGDQPEAMYMVVDGKRFGSVCCFDYGNAETNSKDDGNGAMEAVYWRTDITWGGKGEGNGPWIAADLENGMFKGDKGGWQSQSIVTPSNKSVLATFATAMLKGPSGNHFTLKAGDAQSEPSLPSGTACVRRQGTAPRRCKEPSSSERAAMAAMATPEPSSREP